MSKTCAECAKHRCTNTCICARHYCNGYCEYKKLHKSCYGSRCKQFIVDEFFTKEN